MSFRNSLGETFWAFDAWNQPTLYGWGTEAEADLYEDKINAGREVGHYHRRELTRGQIARLQDRNDIADLAEELAETEEQAHATHHD